MISHHIPRFLYWLLASPLLALLTFTVLTKLSPVHFDGAGPMPSFYWGQRPFLPSAAEYNRNPDFYDRQYRRPYLVAAVVITLLALPVSTLAVRFIPSVLLTAAALLALCLASDIGSTMDVWSGPRILTATFETLTKLVPAILGLALASAVLAKASHTPFTTNQNNPKSPPPL